MARAARIDPRRPAQRRSRPSARRNFMKRAATSTSFSAAAGEPRRAVHTDRRHSRGDRFAERHPRSRAGAEAVSAFVSIMQGCNMHCTFCIVPSTRGCRALPPDLGDRRGGRVARRPGRARGDVARPDRQPLRPARIPCHRRPLAFAQLLHAVSAVPGLERLRFTSPHPIGFKEDLIACFAELPNLCEHVHLPVQSGSDRILKAMHRAYTRDNICAWSRNSAPHSRAWR